MKVSNSECLEVSSSNNRNRRGKWRSERKLGLDPKKEEGMVKVLYGLDEEIVFNTVEEANIFTIGLTALGRGFSMQKVEE